MEETGKEEGHTTQGAEDRGSEVPAGTVQAATGPG